MLDALGVEPPAAIRGVTQAPIEGVSFAHTFDDAEAPTEHHTQYFEMFGHRAIYHDGWRAVCPWPGPNFAEAGVQLRRRSSSSEDMLTELDANGWELYDVEDDPPRPTTSPTQQPRQADRDDRAVVRRGGQVQRAAARQPLHERFADERPQIAAPRDTYVYYPGTQTRARNVARQGAQPRAQHHRRRRDSRERRRGRAGRATAATPAATSSSSRTAGCTTSTTTSAPRNSQRVLRRSDPRRKARAALRVRADRGAGLHGRAEAAPGGAQLYVDGEQVGQGELPVTVPLALGLGSGFAVGRNPGSATSTRYASPFPFTGTISKVTVDVSGKPDHDEAEAKKAEARVAMARQ